MKFGILWRVDLDGEDEVGEFRLAQVNETIEQHFPINIARKIIVSDDEAVDVLLVIFANDSFDVLRGRGSDSCGLAR
ncbi:MAG: hypothetical protein WA796_24325 [Pseudolabrys sp.]